MSFAENLKQIRKNRNLSQEELAEIMDVSRQAVSKWEQGLGYPEVEKLILLSSKLNISLDSLMSTEIAQKTTADNKNISGTIIIISPYENTIVSCYKVTPTEKMHGGKNSPQYALFGFSNEGISFWGQPTTFLGWYADKESLSNEVHEIQQAILQGLPSYELKYNVKVEKNWFRIKIIQN